MARRELRHAVRQAWGHCVAAPRELGDWEPARCVGRVWIQKDVVGRLPVGVQLVARELIWKALVWLARERHAGRLAEHRCGW